MPQSAEWGLGDIYFLYTISVHEIQQALRVASWRYIYSMFFCVDLLYATIVCYSSYE